MPFLFMYMFDSKDSLRWTYQIAASRGKKLEKVLSVARKKAPNRMAQRKRGGGMLLDVGFGLLAVLFLY